jgi:hypothetical protein
MKTQTPLKDPNDRQKINYTALFGCFIIKVISDSKENAKIAVLNKFNSFKDGGTKKEYIRAKITTEDFKVWTDRELI